MKSSVFCFVLLLLIGCQTPGEDQSRAKPADPTRSIVREMEDIAGDVPDHDMWVERIRGLNASLELATARVRDLHAEAERDSELGGEAVAADFEEQVLIICNSLNALAQIYEELAAGLNESSRQYLVAALHGEDWVSAHHRENGAVRSSVLSLCNTYRTHAQLFAYMAEVFQRNSREYEARLQDMTSDLDRAW